jgi:hypothetical protein
MIIEANGLDPNDFLSWVFFPEMLFNSPDLTYESFVWNNMRDPDLVTLIDPLSLIELPYQVADFNFHCHSRWLF